MEKMCDVPCKKWVSPNYTIQMSFVQKPILKGQAINRFNIGLPIFKLSMALPPEIWKDCQQTPVEGHEGINITKYCIF